MRELSECFHRTKGKKNKKENLLLTELDLCILREQHILALDVSVDDFVGMEVGEALLAHERGDKGTVRGDLDAGGTRTRTLRPRVLTLKISLQM